MQLLTPCGNWTFMELLVMDRIRAYIIEVNVHNKSFLLIQQLPPAIRRDNYADKFV